MSKKYSNVEKALLQFVMASGPIQEEILVSVHGKLKKEFDEADYNDEEVTQIKNRDLEDCIEVINSRLHDLGFEIVRARNQETLEALYVYINTMVDNASSTFTRHSKPEIEAMKKMIESIFMENEDEQYAITSTDAHRICRIETHKSASEIEVFLKDLVSEGWFDQTHGRYFLSVKALAELRRTFLDKYGARTKENSQGLVNICSGCRDIVTRGVRCPNRQCYVRFHKNCQINFSTARGTACPGEGCDVDWNEQELLYVGERAMNQKVQHLRSIRGSTYTI